MSFVHERFVNSTAAMDGGSAQASQLARVAEVGRKRNGGFRLDGWQSGHSQELGLRRLSTLVGRSVTGQGTSGANIHCKCPESITKGGLGLYDASPENGTTGLPKLKTFGRFPCPCPFNGLL